MSDKMKIKVWLNIGISSCDHDDIFDSDYTLEEWRKMSKREQDEYLEEVANGHASNYLDFGAEVVEDEQAQ